MSANNVAEVLAQLDFAPLADAVPFHLQVGAIRVELRCTEPLRSVLVEYFADAIAGDGAADAVVEVLEGQQLSPAPEFVDWAREPGKAGRKDAIRELEDGRLVHKVRTGITFLQSPERLVAFGPCAEHPNQIINFVNTQVLNICQRQGWEICHAAAVTDGTRTLAVAGLSGGGKSTAVLRLMDIDRLAFVTNDRLLVRTGTPVPEALGIAKMPRINPGTILHNPRLHPLIPEARRAELAALPPQHLWDLEEKHDLPVGALYGAGRVRFDAPLTHFWVLNWQRVSDEPPRVTPVNLPERPDLLAAIMKSPGPFYQKPGGAFLTDDELPEPAGYLAALEGVQVYEVSGRIDFDHLHGAGVALFGGSDPA